MSAIERYLLIATFFLIFVFSAYQFGKISAINKIESESLKEEVKDIKSADSKKDELAKDLNKLQSDKNDELEKILADYRNIYNAYQRMRVGKSCANGTETVAIAAGNDKGNASGEIREGTGGIYIGDIAQQILSLGEDLDLADLENNNLKKAVVRMHEKCSITAN